MKLKFFSKVLTLIIFFISVVFSANAQIFDPIKWSFEVNTINETEAELIIKAEIEKDWHLYAVDLPSNDGPEATIFTFTPSENYELIGGIEEGKYLTQYDPNFDMDLNFHEHQATFKQKIKVNTTVPFKVSGNVAFMVCNNEMCLPPDEVDFELNINGDAITDTNVDTEEASTNLNDIIPSIPQLNMEQPLNNCGVQKQEINNVWMVFLFGFLGGLLALLTPCVFPMIPLTVSFFTKGGKEGSKGIGRAILYGFFIFFIYFVLSIPFHFNTDPELLNEIATSVWLNIIFFVVFLVFAISFFGFFEITLPSSLANKADSASNTGGILGIFFMALTLALVSFSCTGPILGTVLGNSLKNGPWPITAAMSGFGVALGLPFALFAMFPSFMKKLPQSGGWLNSVKVVLGFIELALALKFLSNADLVQQWGLIKRETFFLIWTIIGVGLFLYLVGIIKFPHDSPSGKPSKFKIIFTTIIGLFTIYIAPGALKKSPWNHHFLSGFPPPSFYSWYDNETFHAEFTDFNEALAEAKATNKPLLIDFTGWACVNCRKMEESVWTVGSVKKKLKNDFVLVSLYVDDKVELPTDQQGVFEYEVNGNVKKKKIKTIGNKWATFQTHLFNNNSQPYYVMLSPDGELLANPIGYTTSVEEYEEYLDCGINTFKEQKKEEATPQFQVNF
ncbi:MAG: thioredoxin family protein [Flavobacteriales bacterium]|nr:thioredoxin family protein [Flavobacteriales bacterium]